MSVPSLCAVQVTVYLVMARPPLGRGRERHGDACVAGGDVGAAGASGAVVARPVSRDPSRGTARLGPLSFTATTMHV